MTHNTAGRTTNEHSLAIARDVNGRQGADRRGRDRLRGAIRAACHGTSISMGGAIPKPLRICTQSDRAELVARRLTADHVLSIKLALEARAEELEARAKRLRERASFEKSIPGGIDRLLDEASDAQQKAIESRRLADRVYDAREVTLMIDSRLAPAAGPEDTEVDEDGGDDFGECPRTGGGR